MNARAFFARALYTTDWHEDGKKGGYFGDEILRTYTLIYVVRYVCCRVVQNPKMFFLIQISLCPKN